MTNNEIGWILVALAALAMVIVAAMAARRRSRMRSVELRQRFGPEYDRAVEQYGSPARAERELASRARRVDHIRFRELSEADRARFTTSWNQIQALFVDDPSRAVIAANDLIKEVMAARGYATDDYEQRVADLSVAHAPVVQHYRAARALSESSRQGRLNTEELRQAVVHYRAMFADLLQESGPTTRALREAHA
jgi:hypothetical protein